MFGGAGTEDTQRANREAFAPLADRPADAARRRERDLRDDVLGTAMPAPVLLARSACSRSSTPTPSWPSPRAAARTGVPIVASTASSFTLEEIAEAGGADAPRWFQLYWPATPTWPRASSGAPRRAGYRAIVVTLDTSLLAWRPRDLQRRLPAVPAGRGHRQLPGRPGLPRRPGAPPEEDPQAAIGHFVAVFSNPAVTWEDLAGCAS